MYQVTKMLNSFENNKLQLLILSMIENAQKCVTVLCYTFWPSEVAESPNIEYLIF